MDCLPYSQKRDIFFKLYNSRFYILIELYTSVLWVTREIYKILYNFVYFLKAQVYRERNFCPLKPPFNGLRNPETRRKIQLGERNHMLIAY